MDKGMSVLSKGIMQGINEDIQDLDGLRVNGIKRW